jgi:hypothetical protein
MSAKKFKRREKTTVKVISSLIKLDLGNLWLLEKLCIMNCHHKHGYNFSLNVSGNAVGTCLYAKAGGASV